MSDFQQARLPGSGDSLGHFIAERPHGGLAREGEFHEAIKQPGNRAVHHGGRSMKQLRAGPARPSLPSRRPQAAAVQPPTPDTALEYPSTARRLPPWPPRSRACRPPDGPSSFMLRPCSSIWQGGFNVAAFSSRDVHLIKKALAIAILVIERQDGPFQPSSDPANIKGLAPANPPLQRCARALCPGRPDRRHRKPR
jgi:hypothetical protein